MDEITRRLARTYRLEEDRARAVHWKGADDQAMRFEALARGIVAKPTESVRILDAGCGLAELLPFLRERWPHVDYTGVDAVEAFVRANQASFPSVTFVRGDMMDVATEHDYAVVSGSFNEVPDGVGHDEFADWVTTRIRHLFARARRGVVFNVIADLNLRWRNPKNFYASVPALVDLATSLSRFFTLWHDYPLYEVTVAIYQETFVKGRYGERGDWR